MDFTIDELIMLQKGLKKYKEAGTLNKKGLEKLGELQNKLTNQRIEKRLEELEK